MTTDPMTTELTAKLAEIKALVDTPVQRFTLILKGDSGIIEIHKDNNGPFVHYDDFAQTTADMRLLLSTIAELVEDKNKLELLLKNLVRDSMATDFNKHWDSFKAAECIVDAARGKEKV